MTNIKVKFKGINELHYLVGDFWEIVKTIKTCSGRQYNPHTKIWTIELNTVNLNILKNYLDNRYEYYKSLLVSPVFDKKQYSFLLPFQQEGVKMLLDNKILLADSVGSGKTIQAIVYCVVNDFKRVLIVCPAPIKRVWKDEIYKFLKEDSIILEGNSKKRKEQYDKYIEENQRFLIVNYEQLRESNSFLINRNWDCSVLDEIHRVKNSKTISYKIISKLDVRKKIGLSARPQENNVREIFNIMNLLTDKSFMKWKEFENNYCIRDDVYNVQLEETINVIVGYCNFEMFHEKLKHLMIMRKRNEVLEDMPERFNKDIYFNLNSKEQELHNAFVSQAENAYENDDMNNILANITFAREVCDGINLINPNEINDSSKLKILQDILLDIDDKVVIFTQWAKMAHLIVDKLGFENCVLITGETKNKQQGIDDFRRLDKKYLVTTDCLSYGVNIEFSHIVIHFDLVWNPAKLEQRTGRIDRLNQKVKNLLVIRLIADNSIEKHVIDILNQKEKDSSIILSGISNELIINNLFKKLKKGEIEK